MQRFKYLIHKGKKIELDYLIKEILVSTGHNWLMDTEFEEAEIEIKDNMLTWITGKWYNGVWLNGVWLNGEWFGGEWLQGRWKNGIWHDGTWHDGVFEDGIFKLGEFKKGIKKN